MYFLRRVMNKEEFGDGGGGELELSSSEKIN
jgi:hypothetical protein